MSPTTSTPGLWRKRLWQILSKAALQGQLDGLHDLFGWQRREWLNFNDVASYDHADQLRCDQLDGDFPLLGGLSTRAPTFTVVTSCRNELAKLISEPEINDLNVAISLTPDSEFQIGNNSNRNCVSECLDRCLPRWHEHRQGSIRKVDRGGEQLLLSIEIVLCYNSIDFGGHGHTSC